MTDMRRYWHGVVTVDTPAEVEVDDTGIPVGVTTPTRSRFLLDDSGHMVGEPWPIALPTPTESEDQQ